MHVTVVALDTRGGVQPYVALSLGLRQAGHDVRLAAPEAMASMVTDRGLDLVPITDSPEGKDVDARGVAEMPPLRRLRFMREHTLAEARHQAGELVEAAAGSDVVTGGFGGSLIGGPVAERLGVPFVHTHLQPLGPPTADFPGIMTPNLPRVLGRTARRASHPLSYALLRTAFRAAERSARTDALALPARPVPARAGLPVLYGYSPLVVPPGREWGPEHRVTGYWSLPAPATWAPSPELAAFLDAGPPPVAIGFGSMGSADPAATTDLVVRAVRAAGARAVLLSGWGGMSEQVAGDDVVVVDEAPHDWLYPRTAAVVHHGGAGTTGAGLSAGVPAVVVPFAVDQRFWGARVSALGVGPKPLPRRGLTAGALAAALSATLADRAMAERAADLGRSIRAERGVETAVASFDELARTRLR